VDKENGRVRILPPPSMMSVWTICVHCVCVCLCVCGRVSVCVG
jgi:hypothetical protein